jgi:hypothetical protein
MLPLTPDDRLPDLEEWLAKLQAPGPMQYEPGEREMIGAHLPEMNNLSKIQMERLHEHLRFGNPPAMP